MSSVTTPPSPEILQRLQGRVHECGNLQRHLKRAELAADKRLARIEKSRKQGKNVAQLRDLHLRSPGTMLVALASARAALLKAENYKRRKQHLPLLTLQDIRTDAALLRMAIDIDLWRTCSEPAYASYINKPGGGRREVISFGLENKARQLALKEAIEKQCPESSGQFTRTGRHKACAALKCALEVGDYKWAFLTDVRDCFGSITETQVADTSPLPRGLMPMLMQDAHNIVPRRGHNLANRPGINGGSCGIPQGSSASSIVAELVLEPLLKSVEREGRFVGNYADNFVGLAKSRREVSMIQHTLHEAARLQHTSRLDFHHTEVRRLDHGFDFLGYWFQRKQGRVVVRPKAIRLSEFEFRSTVLIALNRPMTEIRSYVHSWCSQFCLVQGIEITRDRVMQTAEARKRMPDRSRYYACLADLARIFKRYDRKKREHAREYPRNVRLQQSVSGTYNERFSRFIQGWLRFYSV